MEVIHFSPSDPLYPKDLKLFLGNNSPASITALGNLDILKQDKLAFFCSVRCPGALILQTHDLAQQLRQAGVTVIGGFHSPIERECLKILLRGTQPLILCPARSLTKLRIQSELKKSLEAGRLLFLSPFAHHRHRSDVEMALYRNRSVAALADRIFVGYAAPSSKTEQFCREILGWRKPVFTLGSEFNKNLLTLGAKAITPEQAGLLL